MIIYGYKHKEVELGTGHIHCFSCQVQRPYRHKKMVRYFTLFFIPLFPLGTLHEYVECQVCGRTYAPGILSDASTTSMPISETDRYGGGPQNIESSQKTDKKNSCLPWVLAGGGILSILGGLLMGIALIATQTDPELNQGMGSFILAVLCCPTPMVILGLLAIGAGIYLLRSKEDSASVK